MFAWMTEVVDCTLLLIKGTNDVHANKKFSYNQKLWY